MKYIKTYENINELQIGDYAIFIPGNIIPKSEDFFNNTIGKIINKSRQYKDISYGVEYENIPKFIKEYYCAWRQHADGTQYLENIIWFRQNMIKYYGKTIEEVELKKQSNKFNL